MKTQLYCCYEREVYERMEYYGYFESDTKAIKGFKERVNKGMGNKAEWYVGLITTPFTEIVTTFPSKEIKIFKTTYNKDWKISD